MNEKHVKAMVEASITLFAILGFEYITVMYLKINLLPVGPENIIYVVTGSISMAVAYYLHNRPPKPKKRHKPMVKLANSATSTSSTSNMLSEEEKPRLDEKLYDMLSKLLALLENNPSLIKDDVKSVKNSASDEVKEEKVKEDVQVTEESKDVVEGAEEASTSESKFVTMDEIVKLREAMQTLQKAVTSLKELQRSTQ